MSRVDEYLSIPLGYGRWLGGLRWCAQAEAIEFSAPETEIGLTFAFSPEIGLFIEGMVSQGVLTYFAHVLHLMSILSYNESRRHAGPREVPSRPFNPALDDVCRLFRHAGRPHRNAGALCAELCRGVPEFPAPPSLRELHARLGARQFLHPPGMRRHPGLEPPMPPLDFEALVVREIQAYSESDLKHWFQHGRGPLRRAGESVARAMPATHGEALKSVESRPRLRGVGPLVARLAGALSLPPRRLVQSELPVGGYSDVATRGLPEQILPGQFALDPDEFLRRFAQRELLYFHREEPRAPTTRDVVLVLDRGVRTWGDTRLILAAAVLALSRLSHQRKQSVLLTATGLASDPVDPATCDVETLGSVLEASDLSRHPGEALARILSRSTDEPRDVVLLTHPRTLSEPAVEQAIGLARGETRLFSVAARPSGEVVFAQLRNGHPVVIGQCRVPVGSSPSPAPVETRPSAPTNAWRGDVEPVGFPFQIGPTHSIKDHLFAFDDSGDWLLLANRHGLLRVWRIDGTAAEMLPRPYYRDNVLIDVSAVVGVAGGFVVAGHVDRSYIAAHYNLVNHICRIHVIGEARRERSRLYYNRNLHAIIVQTGGLIAGAIDLHNHRPETGEPVDLRAAKAFLAARDQLPETRVVDFSPELSLRFRNERGTLVSIDRFTGDLHVRRGAETGWTTFTYQTDGRVRFKGARLIQARWHRDVLALLLNNTDGRRCIAVGSVADGAWHALGEFAVQRDIEDFALSSHGHLIAWRVGDRRIEVHATRGTGPPVLVIPQGRVHSGVLIEFIENGLLIDSGRHIHFLNWAHDELVHRVHHHARSRIQARLPVDLTSTGLIMTRMPRRLSRYDQSRFYGRISSPGLTAAVDRFGEVALFDRSDRLIAMFFVFRDRFAAWLPDGTRAGSPPILGGPATAGAMERIGQAIRSAIERSGETGGAW